MSAFSASSRHPLARTDDLILTELPNQVVVYDTRTYALHRLDPAASAVWSACDGTRSISDLAALATVATGQDISPMSVSIALDLLVDLDLVTLPDTANRIGLSRRQAMKLAAAGVVVPTIVSVTAPAAAQIPSPVSCNGATCGLGQMCCGGVACSYPDFCCNQTPCTQGATCTGPNGSCGCDPGTQFCATLNRCANPFECDEANCTGMFRWCPGDPPYCRHQYAPC